MEFTFSHSAPFGFGEKYNENVEFVDLGSVASTKWLGRSRSVESEIPWVDEAVPGDSTKLGPPPPPLIFLDFG